MNEPVINGKTLYTPKGAAREYAAVGCNFYTGCPHDCEYCYLKRGAPSKQLGGTEVKLKKCFKNHEDAVMRLCAEMDKYKEYLQKVGIFLSFTTDPLIPETRELTKATIIHALSRSIPVMLLTKNADFVNNEVFMSWMKLVRKDSVAFGFTLTGRNDMEPKASTNEERILAMLNLHKMGFKTWASIEPIIDIDSSLDMIQRTLGFCDLYKVGLRSGVKRDYYKDDDIMLMLQRIWKYKMMDFGKFYIKDSIRKRLNNHPVIREITVSQDYNLFAHD